MRKRRIYISFLITALFLISCKRIEVKRHDVVVLGHGGGGFMNLNSPFPPNSEASIKQAILLQGADGVELDVQLTKDDVLVLFHDERLDPATQDTGYISNYTGSQLEKITYRSPSDPGNNHGIYKLRDLLRFLDSTETNVWLSLNLHPQKEVRDQEMYNRRFSKALELALSVYGNKGQVIVESPEIENLRAMKPLHRLGIKLYYTQPINAGSIAEVKGDSLDGFVANYLYEDENSVKAARDEGLGIALYGIKIRMDIVPALNLKPDFVQVDNVPLTLSYLD